MNKQELLDTLKLLSALEAMLVFRTVGGASIPDYLLEDLNRSVRVLEREILK